MKMIEIDLNIMSAPQSYYLAQGISKDLNFPQGFRHSLRECME